MYKMNAPAKDDNSNKLFRSRIEFLFLLIHYLKKNYKFKLRRGARGDRRISITFISVVHCRVVINFSIHKPKPCSTSTICISSIIEY